MLEEEEKKDAENQLDLKMGPLTGIQDLLRVQMQDMTKVVAKLLHVTTKVMKFSINTMMGLVVKYQQRITITLLLKKRSLFNSTA